LKKGKKLSRGYGRKTKGFIEVATNNAAQDVGDEPLQIKQKFPNLTVCVDEKRVHGAQQLLSLPNPPQVIILDDAYQHRYIKPSTNILLVDFNRPIFNDMVFPAGRLREPAFGKNRAHCIVVSKCPNGFTQAQADTFLQKLKPSSHQSVFFTTFSYGKTVNIHTKTTGTINELKNKEILVITGIAKPKPLYDYLKENKLSFTTKSYPDHYQFAEKDLGEWLAFLQNHNTALLTTEKDAVRLQNFPSLKPFPIYYIPIKVQFLFNGEKEFQKLISTSISRQKIS
jgi:tetraacyldisaccharide 4'-kinase